MSAFCFHACIRTLLQFLLLLLAAPEEALLLEALLASALADLAKCLETTFSLPGTACFIRLEEARQLRVELWTAFAMWDSAVLSRA